MSEVISLSAENFDSITSRGIVLVEFYATWCGPCKMLTPIVEQLAAEYEEIVFAKGNIEDLAQHCASVFWRKKKILNDTLQFSEILLAV